MRFLSTRTHGIIDYIVGVALILAPFILGFANGGAAMWVPIILGAGAILYSLLTDYEMGVVRRISMRTHLGIDAIGGILLAVSPWLFNFDELVVAPHLIVGLLVLGASMTTETEPSPTRRGPDTATRA